MLLKREGPMNIGLMKELTGRLVKEITPALHKLQEAFLVFEDQADNEWDRAWYLMEGEFPELNLSLPRGEAVEAAVLRFAYRIVAFDLPMAKSFFRLPVRDLKAAVDGLLSRGGSGVAPGGRGGRPNFAPGGRRFAGKRGGFF